ncbi:hypothetical protein PMAYCL1PPCAC_29997, partial [Pristionchus mayeri]
IVLSLSHLKSIFSLPLFAACGRLLGSGRGNFGVLVDGSEDDERNDECRRDLDDATVVLVVEVVGGREDGKESTLGEELVPSTVHILVYLMCPYNEIDVEGFAE